MNDKKYRWILYLITIVILGTICIQVYWNYKNYLTNKQQLINDVQVSLDNAVDIYYANLAKNSAVANVIKKTLPRGFLKEDSKSNTILGQLEFSSNDQIKIDTIDSNQLEYKKLIPTQKSDSIIYKIDTKRKKPNEFSNQLIIRGFNQSESDSVSLNKLRILISRVIVSITQDSLNLKEINSILINELGRKK